MSGAPDAGRRAAVAAATPMPAGYSPTVYGVSKAMVAIGSALWFRLRIEGKQHVPHDGPLLAVGNHCSYLDPPLLGVGMPRPVRFLAQKGLAKFPPLRWWLRKVGVGLIDRKAPSKDVLRALADALQQGGLVSVFAEGTRSPDGRVGPFRSGVEFLVRRTGARVLPVGIDGSFRSFPRGGWLPKPTKCVVRLGEVWSAERVLAPGGIEALRREIARLAHAELTATVPAGVSPEAAPPATAQVDHGPGAIPADPPSSSAGNRA